MVVWFAHVRVGHRQLSIPENPLNLIVKGVFFVREFLNGYKSIKVDFVAIVALSICNISARFV